jgi:hypothetical protein
MQAPDEQSENKTSDSASLPTGALETEHFIIILFNNISKFKKKIQLYLLFKIIRTWTLVIVDFALKYVHFLRNIIVYLKSVFFVLFLKIICVTSLFHLFSPVTVRISALQYFKIAYCTSSHVSRRTGKVV